MKKNIYMFIFLLFMLLLFGCASINYKQTGDFAQITISKNFDKDKHSRVAIMPFQNVGKNGVDQAISDQFTNYFMELGFTVIDRSQLDSIFKELEVKVEEPISSEQVKKIGERLNIDALVVGTIAYSYVPGRSQGKSNSNQFYGQSEGASIDSYYVLTHETLRMIDIESGEVLISAFCRRLKGGSISFEIFLKLKSTLSNYS